MAYTIEKGIPVWVNSRDTELTKTLRAMEIDDSIYIPKRREQIANQLNRLSPIKFVTRKEKEGIRVWRVA
jgi:hypothetical protein